MKDDQNANTAMPSLPRGVQYHHEPDVDTITWVNKDVPISIGIVVAAFMFCLLWIATTVYFGYGLFTVGISEHPLFEQIIIVAVFIVFSVIAFFSPTILLGLNSRVTIKISDEDIAYSRSAPFAEEKLFKKEDVLGLFYDRISDGDGKNIAPLLAIKYKTSIWGIAGTKYEGLALWMKMKEEYRLFLFMRAILEARRWEIEFSDIYSHSIWYSKRSIFD